MMAGEEVDILDLSTVVENYLLDDHHLDHHKIRRFMKLKFPNVKAIKRILSSYRIVLKQHDFGYVYNSKRTYYYYAAGQLEPRLERLFFPVSILLHLVPIEEERILRIESIVLIKSIYKSDSHVGQFGRVDWIDNHHNKHLICKGKLIVDQLTIIDNCCSVVEYDEFESEHSSPCNLKKLREELSLYGITINKCKLKVFFRRSFQQKKDFPCIRHLNNEQLKEVQDEITLVEIEPSTGIKFEDIKDLEELETIPFIKDDYMCPHMFDEYHIDYYDFHQSNVIDNYLLQPCKPFSTDKILIATLGYGIGDLYIPPEPPSNPLGDPHMYSRTETFSFPKIYFKNFVNKAPVFSKQQERNFNLLILIHKLIKTASFAICQTTYCDGTVANGATSRAINGLRMKWVKNWSKEYDNLVVFIPYGSKYREDEMIAITKATDEGIIIVCAVGPEEKGNIAYPAALGNVLSVGLANTGPKGKEVDICVEYELVFKTISIATAVITALLSLLLSRINTILRSPSNPLCKAMTDAIKQKPGYLHTCVIRELLINEGTGSHDLQRGYGNGYKIILELLKLKDDELLFKLANVLLKRHVERKQNVDSGKCICCKNKNLEVISVSDESKQYYYHGLTGQGIKVAVVDSDFRDGENVNPGHGDICSMIVGNVAPESTIHHIKDHGVLVPGLRECLRKDLSVDIISCSMGTDIFDSHVSKAVGEAIIAGKIVIFSAGNEGKRFRNSIVYPARIGNVLVVGGRDPFDSHLSFSSVGRELDFLAPAELGTHKGTSYSAPVIAGYIALLLEFIKEMSEEGYRVIVWKEKEWSEVSIWKAAHNVYAIRELLQLMVAKPQAHSEISGFGCLDFSVLFPSYRLRPNVDGQGFVQEQAKNKIHSRLQNFYCSQPDIVKINEWSSLEFLFPGMQDY